jgi:long-subunit fatty acid transport protein
MERSVIIAVLAILMGSQRVHAQSDDFGAWYEIGVEKKLSRQWSIGGEAELRTRDNMKTTDRWSVGLSADYKLNKNLKVSGGYTLLVDNNAEELDLKSDGLTPNKWTPSYWGVRHRFNVSLQGSVKWQRLSFSLRERWQYTYRPAAEGKRYDLDNDAWTDRKGKGKNVLRSRLEVAYDIPNWKFDPYVNAEMFNDNSGISKMRYSIGTEYKWKKKHVFGLSYKYQSVNDSDDDQSANRHIIGLNYKLKF